MSFPNGALSVKEKGDWWQVISAHSGESHVCVCTVGVHRHLSKQTESTRTQGQ